jgi:hypothetical protein
MHEHRLRVAVLCGLFVAAQFFGIFHKADDDNYRGPDKAGEEEDFQNTDAESC